MTESETERERQRQREAAAVQHLSNEERGTEAEESQGEEEQVKATSREGEGT